VLFALGAFPNVTLPPALADRRSFPLFRLGNGKCADDGTLLHGNAQKPAPAALADAACEDVKAVMVVEDVVGHWGTSPGRCSWWLL